MPLGRLHRRTANRGPSIEPNAHGRKTRTIVHASGTRFAQACPCPVRGALRSAASLVPRELASLARDSVSTLCSMSRSDGVRSARTLWSLSRTSASTAGSTLGAVSRSDCGNVTGIRSHGVRPSVPPRTRLRAIAQACRGLDDQRISPDWPNSGARSPAPSRPCPALPLRPPRTSAAAVSQSRAKPSRELKYASLETVRSAIFVPRWVKTATGRRSHWIDEDASADRTRHGTVRGRRERIREFRCTHVRAAKRRRVRSSGEARPGKIVVAGVERFRYRGSPAYAANAAQKGRDANCMDISSSG